MDKKNIDRMSHAFYLLLDRMYENMPDACGSCGDDEVDEYVQEVEGDVADALKEFKEADAALRNEIA